MLGQQAFGEEATADAFSFLPIYIYKTSFHLALYCETAIKEVKVMSPLSLIIWRVRFHAFLTSALNGGEWSASSTDCFASGKSPRYALQRRLRGPTDDLDTVKERFSWPDWNRSPIPRLSTLVAMLTELSRLRGKRNKDGNYNQSEFFCVSSMEFVYLLQQNQKYIEVSEMKRSNCRI
jgi:hypothetical protein